MENSMLNGLWSVIFNIPPSGTANNGNGVVIINNGKIYGGDSNYYYTGNCEIEDKLFTAEVKVTHYAGPYNNVFGEFKEVNVNVKGEADRHEFEANGYSDIEGKQIIIKLEKLSEL
jgi:hypothetical protein